MLLGIIIAILYTLGSIVDLFLEATGMGYKGFYMPYISKWTDDTWGFDIFSWRLFVVLPLWILVVLICVIAIWIGWSMLTTPAPVPLEVNLSKTLCSRKIGRGASSRGSRRIVRKGLKEKNYFFLFLNYNREYF